MKVRRRQRILFCLAAVVFIIAAVTAGRAMLNTFSDVRQREVKNILHFYSENILLQLQGSLNEAEALAQMARVQMDEDYGWFERAAEAVMEKEEVKYACLIEGDTIVKALPGEEYGTWEGREVKELSYAYTLPKLVKSLVVEGPAVLESGSGEKEVFLFLQPILEDEEYQGEVVIALDSDYVLKQFGLESLSEQGYDYELWRVHPQSGEKEVVAVSRQEIDFSHAAKTTFNLPTEWNLSIQPSDGWGSPVSNAGMIVICILIASLFLIMNVMLYKLSAQRYIIKQFASMDGETGLYNYRGFTEQLGLWITKGSPVNLFYFVYEGYNQIAQLIGPEEEGEFLGSILPRLKEFVVNPFIAGRLGEGNYILAVREDMNENEMEDFAKGLSIELLMKIRMNGQKKFLTARYQYAHYKDNQGAKEAISSLVSAYYTRQLQESPVHMLTEKCRQLLDGQSNVVFDEYADLEMMELSKVFNQYRKKVEQLAYFDPVFNVGNRPKYLRDVNMLISYDKKRKFSLFCIDICAFSQYNELFSADIGDDILREVVNRLSRLFGNNLYRINGDVFLGVSMTEESEQAFAEKLGQKLSVPVFVGNTSLTLQARIVVCRYPAHGTSPEELLDRVQSALRFAKESGEMTVIYNGMLDEMIRREADILNRLKSSIRQKTLEVWYQPLRYMQTGEYRAAEALVRLPDGQGGYYPAGQVISLAERGGMAEQVGDYVLNSACSFMKRHGKETGLSHICINVSVQQLLTEDCAGHLIRLIHSSGVDAKQITLEITESVLIQSIDHTSVMLEELRKTGIRVALDDFGVGYSSLNYLSNLPVDVIKIDRSLTRQILTSHKQHALLKAIVDMAGINSLTVVAEGIETAEEEKMISASGVQYIQGFYYARPMPDAELIDFLTGKGNPEGE